MRGRYQSSELVNTATQGRSPAFSTVDATVNQQFGHGVTGFLGVSNLFDRQRDFADANDFGPLSGRLIYVGVTYAFGHSTLTEQLHEQTFPSGARRRRVRCAAGWLRQWG